MCCPSTDGRVFFGERFSNAFDTETMRNVSASFVEVACRTSRGSCGRAIRRGTVFNCTRCRLTFLTGALFFARVALYFARWCNGSTKDSGSFCRGSNPCRAARGRRRVSQAEWVLEATLRKAYLIKSITTQTKKRKIGMPL